MAVTTWESTGIDSCVVVVDQTDLTPEGGCSWITEVHGDVVDSRWSSGFDSNCDEWDVSIPALHRNIATWADEVDGTVGSLVANGDDEESSLRASLTPLP